MKSDRVPARIAWAVSQLSVRRTDRVLEIGCGPGHAVRLLCPLLSRGAIVAIDRSALQVQRALSNNRSCIAAGRARIQQLALMDAPAALGERGFTKVFAINVNAFWTAPSPNFASLSPLVGRTGLAYFFYEPPSAADLSRFRAVMLRLLPLHAFRVEDVRSEDLGKGRGLCVIGRPVKQLRRSRD